MSHVDTSSTSFGVSIQLLCQFAHWLGGFMCALLLQGSADIASVHHQAKVVHC